MSLKDQSGAAASGEWLAENGRGRYSRRTTGRVLANRVTEPITWERYLAICEANLCLGCGAHLRAVRRPDGGQFHVCAADGVKGCGWYCGWRPKEGGGDMVRLDRVGEAHTPEQEVE